MKNNLFSILYVITMVLLAGIVVFNEYYFKNKLLTDGNDNNQLIKLSARQEMLSQKLSKASVSMEYSSDRSKNNFENFQRELGRTLTEWEEVHTAFIDGSETLEINSQSENDEVAAKLEELKFYKQNMVNAANSLLVLKYSARRDNQILLQASINDILQSERKYLPLMADITDIYYDASLVTRTGYDYTELVLFASFIGIFLIQGFFIFRPTVNLAGKNFLSANKAYQKLKKSEEDLRKSYESQILANKELNRSKKELEKKNEELEASEKKLLKSTKEQIAINEKLIEAQKELESAYEKLQGTEEEIREMADKQLEDNEKLFLAEKRMKDLLEKEQKATASLNQAMERLKGTQSQLVHSEKMASLGQLTAGIAHEINNPINFIYNGISSIKMSLESVKEVLEKYSELDEGADAAELKEEILELKEDVEYDELLDDLDEILNDVNYGAVRTIEIVKGLRVFSRLDEEESKPAFINENIDATLTLLKNKTKNQITVSKFYDDTIGEIECYPGQLNQVYMNILNNAIQAMPEDRKDPEIQIYTENLDENTVSIRIKDNGCGIPEEIKQRIFEPFFTTKAVGVGTGLGMSISFGIIEKHGGKIELNSEVGVGTEFVITLPKKIAKKKGNQDVVTADKK